MIDRSKIKIKDYESYYFGVWCGHQDQINKLTNAIKEIEKWQSRAELKMRECASHEVTP